MHAMTVSPSPLLSWLGFGLQVPPGGVSLSAHRRATTFGISVVLAGRRFARWVRRGHEVRWVANTGAVHFVPAEDEFHTCVMKSEAGCDLYAFWIPVTQLSSWAESEELAAPVEWTRIAIDDDPVLRPCMNRLARAAIEGGFATALDVDEIARQMFLRLAELHGARAPGWRKDRSLFDERTLGSLVVYIDEHLRIPPSLGDLAVLVGLSPSHLARKFRRSVGFSLGRFVNLRRVQASLNSLKDGSVPIAVVALDLGFSSQSHFTRVFSELTGMTPAKYRRLFARRAA